MPIHPWWSFVIIETYDRMLYDNLPLQSVVLVSDEDTSVGGLRNVADDAFGIYVRIAWGFADE